MTTDQWRSRQMTVRTLEHRDGCNKLCDEVKEREARNYWPQWSIKLKSCASCFDVAKTKAAAEASGEVYGYC